jgi:uncharacterized LabA/DUF88 family protein
MSVAYQRLVRLIDRRGLSLVLEHALDRRVIVKLCNTCGLSYAGIRTRSVPIETLANDLAKDCFDKEVTGIQVIQTLAKASAQEIDQIRLSKPERIRSFIEEKQDFPPRECCRLTIAILLDERKDLHTTGVDLLNKTERFYVHARHSDRQADEPLTEVNETDAEVTFKKQIHDLNQALIAARNECGRLEKQTRMMEQANVDKDLEIKRFQEALHALPKLKVQVDQLEHENQELRYRAEVRESQAPPGAGQNPLLQSVEKNISDIKQTVHKTVCTIEEEYRGLKQTMGALQKEISALRSEGQVEHRSVQTRRKMEPDSERLGIFVDVQNMFYAAKQYGARLDFEKLMHAAVGHRRLVRAYAYVIQTPEVDQTGFVAMLQQRSYQVRRKDLRLRSDGSAKGDWDMGMAIDMIGMADKLDVIVLVSGDGDFVSLVHLLKEMGPRVEVFSFPHNTARDLMETADRYYPIDEALLIKKDRQYGGQQTKSTEVEENGQVGRWAESSGE